MTLLSKAKTFKNKRRYVMASTEDVELALSYMRGEITLGQVSHAYGKANNAHKILKAILYAYSLGKFTIKK